jgi:hypothetical protein
MSTLAVVEDILRETQIPMSVREIVERAGSRLPSKSKTPDTVVARDLSMDIKKRGDTSMFVRTSPGRYTLRELQACGTVGAPMTAAGVAQLEGVQMGAPTQSNEATSVLSAALRTDRAAPIPARIPASEEVAAMPYTTR